MRAPALKAHDGLAALHVGCTRQEVPLGLAFQHTSWAVSAQEHKERGWLASYRLAPSPAVGRPSAWLHSSLCAKVWLNGLPRTRVYVNTQRPWFLLHTGAHI